MDNIIIEKIINFVLPWLTTHGTKVLIILLVIWAVNKFLKSIIDKIVRKSVRSSRFSSKEAEEKRENTLISVFSSGIRVIVWTTGIIMILSEIGINIGPIIAAAGIAGLALGFGGQYLIRDLISGLFIILENQYRVGDYIEIAGVSGKVEDINLRMTIIRDSNGAVHFVPNGEIKKSTNMSKDFSKVNLKVAVSYDSDLKKVEEIINRVGQELSLDEEFKDNIISPPKFISIDDLSDSGVVIRIKGETKPQKQWAVASELRLRIKDAFDKENITIPQSQIISLSNKK